MFDATPAAAGLARERAALRTVSRAVTGGRAVLVCSAVFSARSILAASCDGAAGAANAS